MSNTPQFPSGEWTGFYVYSGRPERCLMDLILKFHSGHISGGGWDNIGEFFIDGEYSEASMECSWTKTYLGSHSVFYFGFREGKGIWGTWHISRSTGGFHIWPIGARPSEIRNEKEEELDEVVARCAVTPILPPQTHRVPAAPLDE
jgi:hypothetical protein